MKINILYFSSTGNTLWLTEGFTQFAEKNGHTVNCYDVVTEDGQWELNYDLLGIIYPVWCSDVPINIANRINNMKQGNNTKIFMLGNAGVFSGDTGRYWVKKFKLKGYDLYYANHVLLPVNTCFPKFSMFKVPDAKKTESMINEALLKLKVICEDIISFKKYHEGKNIFDKIGGHGQRLKWYKTLMRGRVREMYIDNHSCTNCRLCYKMCPAGAIRINKNSHVEIYDKSKCIFCLKCYNLCPMNAVLIESKSSNTEKYNRYKGLNRKYKPITYR